MAGLNLLILHVRIKEAGNNPLTSVCLWLSDQEGSIGVSRLHEQLCCFVPADAREQPPEHRERHMGTVSQCCYSDKTFFIHICMYMYAAVVFKFGKYRWTISKLIPHWRSTESTLSRGWRLVSGENWSLVPSLCLHWGKGQLHRDSSYLTGNSPPFITPLYTSSAFSLTHAVTRRMI